MQWQAITYSLQDRSRFFAHSVCHKSQKVSTFKIYEDVYENSFEESKIGNEKM